MSTAPAQRATAVPNDLEAYWLPFTPNRAFKAAPRLIARAKDMHYYTPDGRAVLDGTAGMWCTNAGHNRDPIVAAIQAEAAELDYAPAFQFAHPKAFELASRVAALAPGDLDHVFFCNSGSEAVDTALKIALAYHNVRGEGARTRLIGRERGDPARELERLGMGELKRRRVVERGRFRLDRRDDGVAIVPGIGTPHAGGAVEHGAPVGGVVMHVLGARDEPRRRLERAVGRERKPIGFEVVGDGGRPLCWCRWHGAVSFAAFPDAARDGVPCCVPGPSLAAA